MKTSSNDSSSSLTLSPVRVDVRLCGSIPRSDMVDRQGPRGAPCPLSDLSSSDLNASLTSTNGPSSDKLSTLSKSSTDLCQGLARMVAHNPSMARIENGLYQSPPPQQVPIYEPPTWAVPARGEARLEVCLMCGLLYRFICYLDCHAYPPALVPSTASLRSSRTPSLC